MCKLYLLLFCCVILFKVKSQLGSLDAGFGNKGVQTSTFTNNLNTLNEKVRVVLADAVGNIFVATEFRNDEYTTIIGKYFGDGRLDSSYGSAGYSHYVHLHVTSAVMQNDKIIVAGNFNNPDNYHHFELARYTKDGALDSSFGKNGILITDFGSYSDDAISMVLQKDKIVAAASTYNVADRTTDFILFRYDSNGAPDSSFGINGMITTNFQKRSQDYATSIALQKDKIVVGGFTVNYPYNPYTSPNFALARYSADGILDSSFGVNGLAITDFNKSDDRANAIALQDDKIILGGYTVNYTSNTVDFALCRYTADGLLDSSFGDNGKAVTDLNNPDDVYIYDVVANSLALQGSKILLVGYTPNDNGSDVDFAITRFTADGELDSSFGQNGIVKTNFDNTCNRAYSIALQSDKILMGGISGGDFALARYTADGVVDSSFGVRGLITGYFPVEQTSFTSAAIQGSKIIAAGYTYKQSEGVDFDFALTRFTANGAVDSSFGVKGVVTTPFDEGGVINAIALQGDKIIAVGYTGDVEVQNFALARYTTNGVLDSTFGVNGKVITDFYDADNKAKAIAIQGDKILVAGSNAYFDRYPDLALARYTVNGKLDSTFGVNGKVIDTFSDNGMGASSIALQGDKIIVAGAALTRYTADGKLDSTFGVNGKVKATTSGVDYATAAVLQGDKIIMAGYHEYYNDQGYPVTDFSLARYTANGALDTTFGVNGKVTADFNDFYITSLALQEDKIMVGGSGFGDLTLVRYTVNGVLDSSFGVNGKVMTHLGDSASGASIQAMTMHQNRLYAVGALYSLGFYGARTSQGIVAAYQLETLEPAITITDVKVSKDKKFAIVTARLSAPTNKIVRVHFATRDNTATRNEDYTPVSGPLFFVPGLNNTAKIIIPIVDDNQQESNEQFEILLSNAHNATIKDSVAVVTIVDNDDELITKQSTALRINVRPNPFTSNFTVQLQSSNFKQQVSLQVYDVSGRLLEQRNNINVGQSLHLGEQYTAGTYIIEAVQGNKSVQTKVIKTSR